MKNIDLETLNNKLDSILEDNSDNLIYVNVIKLLQDEIYYTYNTDDYTNDFGEKLFYLSPDKIDILKEDLHKILENVGEYIKKDWILTVSDMVNTVLNNYDLFNNASKSYIVDNYSYIEDIVPSTLENTLCDYFIASHLIILTSIKDTLMYLF